MPDLTPVRSSPNWTSTSSAKTRPSGRWPSPFAIAGGGSNCRPRLRKDVTPKNIIMIGPTGVGKTEIARRLAQLVGAPFLKVEATKYTEVGYVGRDVESMIRDLTEIAIGLVKQEQRQHGRDQGARSASPRRCSTCSCPTPNNWEPEDEPEEQRTPASAPATR